MGIRMRIGLSVAAFLVITVPATAQLQTHPSSSKTDLVSHVTEYGKALPPVGFVSFCVRNPESCRGQTKPMMLDLTPERWDLLNEVNTSVNGKIAPMSDQDLFGEPEYWTYPVDAGDCEDYVLLKKRFLENLGFSASALLITVVLDENGDGHAVLLIETRKGDFVLDNRRTDIRLWSALDYKFLKRQSQRDPRKWVALTKAKTDAGELASESEQR
jgi:predicted transglutaminase-like cysteine proteinase